MKPISMLSKLTPNRRIAFQSIIEKIEAEGIPTENRQFADIAAHLQAAHWRVPNAAELVAELTQAVEGFDAKSGTSAPNAQIATKRDLRLSPAQDAALEAAAKAAGMDVQAFVRFVLSQHVSGFVDELPRRKTHGKRVGARRKRKAVQP